MSNPVPAPHLNPLFRARAEQVKVPARLVARIRRVSQFSDLLAVQARRVGCNRRPLGNLRFRGAF